MASQRVTRKQALAEEVAELSAEEVAAYRRVLEQEAAALLQGHADTAMQQEQQRPKRFKMYEDKEYADSNLFKCPRCYYPNYYPSDNRACNKLPCENCHLKFCIVCSKPESASCRCISAAWARSEDPEEANVEEDITPALADGTRIEVYWTEEDQWYVATATTWRWEKGDNGFKRRATHVVYDAVGHWRSTSYWHCLDGETWREHKANE